MFKVLIYNNLFKVVLIYDNLFKVVFVDKKIVFYLLEIIDLGFRGFDI